MGPVSEDSSSNVNLTGNINVMRFVSCVSTGI